MLNSHNFAFAGAHAGTYPKPANNQPLAPMPPGTPACRHAIFVDSMIPKAASHGWQLVEENVVSLGFHIVIVVSLVLAPLYFTQTLDLRQFRATFLIQPAVPPPPPPPPAAPRLVRVQPRSLFTRGTLLAPSSIPRTIAIIHEKPVDAPPVDFSGGVVGGVPGGMPGGSIGGVLGGILGGIPNSAGVVAPPPAAPKKPLRIGGDVKPPRQTSAPHLDYPILAKQAGVQGRVVIDAIIDAHGNVVELHVVSGHPLLIPTALKNVSDWKYEPTYLNGEPIAVAMLVNVDFKIGH